MSLNHGNPDPAHPAHACTTRTPKYREESNTEDGDSRPNRNP